MTKMESFRAPFLNDVIEAVNNWLKNNDNKIEIINSSTCFDSR